MSGSLSPEARKRLEKLLATPEESTPPAGASAEIGFVAVMRGYITADQLEEALSEQRRQSPDGSPPESLGEILLRKGLLDKETLGRLLASQAAGGTALPRFKRYEILEPLGRGGMSVVYRALDRELGRPVAVKVLTEASLLHEGARERLYREAQTVARLSHPHVVTVYDFGEEEGRLYVVMELVSGRSLRQILQGKGCELRSLLEILEKVARGIHHAHEHGIVHRDVKPENILVAESGEPKVADFGLAHVIDAETALTRTGARLGTPYYMAPEQVEGRANQVTPRTDVYALGAILYEILTGKPPHTGDSLAEAFSKILSEEPVSPRRINSKTEGDLETIALKALEKEPGRRYATAQDFADDLRRYRGGEPIEARRTGLAYRFYRRAKRNPVASLFAAGALLAIAFAVGFWIRGSEKARQVQAREESELRAIREIARLSVDGALQLRRAGANDHMQQYLPKLESAYHQTVERAPGLAEVDYLMGRMYRALMEDERALGYQERALRKEPEYAPALYERIVLLTKRYGWDLQSAYELLQVLETGPTTAAAARKATTPTLDEVERTQPELVRIREQILQDCGHLERLIQAGRTPVEPVLIREAGVLAARGILAYHGGRYAEARQVLEEAVKKDPLLEEAWETLARAAWKQSDPATRDKDDILNEVERIYTRGISHDRGYLPHLTGRSYVRIVRAEAHTNRGKDALKDLLAAEGELNTALRLNPRDWEAGWMLGETWAQTAINFIGQLKDPFVDFNGAEERFTAAIGLNKKHWEVWWRRAMNRTHRGTYHMDRGEDPLPAFAAAEEDFKEALRLNKACAGAWNGRGYLQARHGLHRSTRGEDPGEPYAQAETYLTEALRLKRTEETAWRNRGSLRTLKGIHRMSRGDDPTPDLLAGVDDLTEALRINPAYANARADRGQALSQLALFRERGNDRRSASRDYEAAAEDYAEAIRINPALERRIGQPRAAAAKKAAELRMIK